MYKSINLHSDTDKHDFASLEEALVFFATGHKIKILSKYKTVNGLTAGKDTMVNENINIGLYKELDSNDPMSIFYQDVPDEVVVLQNQETEVYPLG